MEGTSNTGKRAPPPREEPQPIRHNAPPPKGFVHRAPPPEASTGQSHGGSLAPPNNAPATCRGIYEPPQPLARGATSTGQSHGSGATAVRTEIPILLPDDFRLNIAVTDSDTASTITQDETLAKRGRVQKYRADVPPLPHEAADPIVPSSPQQPGDLQAGLAQQRGSVLTTAHGHGASVQPFQPFYFYSQNCVRPRGKRYMTSRERKGNEYMRSPCRLPDRGGYTHPSGPFAQGFGRQTQRNRSCTVNRTARGDNWPPGHQNTNPSHAQKGATQAEMLQTAVSP